MDPEQRGLGLHRILQHLKAGVGLESRGATSHIGTQGGYLIPSPLFSGVLVEAIQTSSLLSGCRYFPLGEGNSLELPILAGTDRATGPYGGLLVKWTGEDLAMPDQDLNLGMILVNVYDANIFMIVSNQFLSDSPAGEATVQTALRDSMTWGIEHVLLRGDGLAKPRGCLSDPNRIVVNRAVANSVSYVDLTNMVTRLNAPVRPVWYISPRAWQSILQAQDGANHYIMSPLVTEGGVAPPRLLGIPYVISDFCADLGSEADVCLVDANAIGIVIRKGATIERSTEYRFQYNQTCYRTVFRMGAAPLSRGAVTPYNGSTYKLGWVVVLN